MDRTNNIRAGITAKWAAGLTDLQYLKIARAAVFAEIAATLFFIFQTAWIFVLIVYEAYWDGMFQTDTHWDGDKFGRGIPKFILCVINAGFCNLLYASQSLLKEAIYDPDEFKILRWIKLRIKFSGTLAIGATLYLVVDPYFELSFWPYTPIPAVLWLLYSIAVVAIVYCYWKRRTESRVRSLEGFFGKIWTESFGPELTQKIPSVMASRVHQRAVLAKLVNNILVPTVILTQ